MALVPTEKAIPLFGGLDLKTDTKYVAPDKNLTLQNVRFPAVRRAEKRYGQSVLSNSIPLTGGFITTGKALGSFGNELLAYDGTALYGYSEASGSWQSRGNLTETTVSISNVTAGVNSAIDVSSASNGSAEVYAWADTNGNVYYSARDAISGTSYRQNVLLQVGSGPQVVICGEYAYIFVLDGTILTAHRLGLGNLGAGVLGVTIISTAILAGTYHAARTIGVTNIVLAFVYNTGELRYGVYNSTLAQQWGSNAGVSTFATGTRLSIAAEQGYMLGANSACFFLAAVTPNVANTCTVIAQTFSGYPSGWATVSVTGPFGAAYTINRVAMAYFNGQLLLVGDASVGSTLEPKPFVFTATCTYPRSGGLAGFTMTTNTNFQFGLQLASQLAVRADGAYWIVASPSTNASTAASQQTTYFLCGTTLTASNPTILSRYLGDQALLGVGNPAAVSVLDSGDIFLGQPYRAVLRADSGGTLFTSAYVTGTTISFPATSSLQVVPFNGGALINCGIPYTYDGAQLVESGFWEFPDGISVSTNTPYVSGDAYLYQYYTVYEWTDAKGNITYSAPSYANIIALAAEIGGAVTCTLALPYMTLTQKSNVQIGVYRTAANSSSPAYKVGTIPNLTTGAGTVNFTDNTTDLVATGGQRLYAPADGSGEIENDPAPPFRFMVATKTRIFGIPQDNPYQIWYSKPVAFGRAAEFSAAQAVPIETAGGAVTALSALDTQAVVFKAERIYYLPGDGPNAAGKPYNAFPSSLQLIASTTGCTSNLSVLATAEGLYFQSPTGLTQLTRGVQVNPAFGLPVQPLVQSLTLTGALAVPSQNQLRWTSTSGTCVVYDYVTQRWSTYTNYDCIGYQPFNGTYARLRTDGRVWYEDTTTFLDNGVGVQMLIETAWLKPAELAQGFAAVWYALILGEYKSAHNLVIECAYDYLDLPADTAIFNATTNGNFGFYGSGSPYGSDPYYGSSSASVIYSTAYQPRYALKRQVCEAVKFKIYDTGITGASCTLNEIALQLGVIGGLKRVPSGQQV